KESDREGRERHASPLSHPAVHYYYTEHRSPVEAGGEPSQAVGSSIRVSTAGVVPTFARFPVSRDKSNGLFCRRSLAYPIPPDMEGSMRFVLLALLVALPQEPPTR